MHNAGRITGENKERNARSERLKCGTNFYTSSRKAGVVVTLQFEIVDLQSSAAAAYTYTWVENLFWCNVAANFYAMVASGGDEKVG